MVPSVHGGMKTQQIGWREGITSHLFPFDRGNHIVDRDLQDLFGANDLTSDV